MIEETESLVAKLQSTLDDSALPERTDAIMIEMTEIPRSKSLLRITDNIDVENMRVDVDNISICDLETANEEGGEENITKTQSSFITSSKKAFVERYMGHCIRFFEIIALGHASLLLVILSAKFYALTRVTIIVLISSPLFLIDFILFIFNGLLLYFMFKNHKRIAVLAMLGILILTAITISHHLFYFPITELTFPKFMLQDLPEPEIQGNTISDKGA